MEKTAKTDLEQNVCESCGQQFGCGAKLEGCWCAKLTITEARSEELKAKYRDCLCPACLRAYIDRSELA